MTTGNTTQSVTMTPVVPRTQDARIVGKNEDSQVQKDMFIKLLIAQLKNQDPTAPMDQKDMMASMTQFSQVEQMQNMAQAMQTLSLSQGIGLIGKDVAYTKVMKNEMGQTIGEKTFYGTVEHVEQGAGGIKLVLVRPPGASPDDPAVTISPAEVTEVHA